MTGLETGLSYSLSGYDYAGANRILLRRLLPGYQRHAFLILPAVLVVLPFALALAVRHGYPLLGTQNWLFFVAVPIVLTAAIWQRHTLTRNAIANAPSRSGITSLVIDDEGMTFATSAVRSTVFWAGIVDILPGKDGFLVLCGDMEYFPIPAIAFKDTAHQKAVLDVATAKISAAKGQIP